MKLGGFGPVTLAGTWIGTDHNSSFDDENNLPTHVLADATVDIDEVEDKSGRT
jgi:hypothetical protein